MKTYVSKIILKLFLLTTVFNCHRLAAQEGKDFQFGKISSVDFDLPKSSVIDNNTNAVIIADIGTTNFVGNKNNWFSYVYKRYCRIKIINKKAFDLAEIAIPLYGEKDYQDKIENIRATSYFLENGRIIATPLKLDEVFEEKLNNFVSKKKFTLPAIKEGSIIEYTYIINSYYYNYLPTWWFQHLEYPCLYSKYEIVIPKLLNYLTLRHGIDSVSYSRTESDKTFHYNMGDNIDVSTITNKNTWVSKDVPAFKSEEYINNPNDYLDKIDFQLLQTYDGENIHNIAINWDNATTELLGKTSFGTAINTEYSTNLINTVQKITGNETDMLGIAKAIYFYIRDNFVCVDNNYIYLEHDLYDVNKNKKGSVAEINMLLIALLRQKGIIADPVILSTKEYGTNPSNYPVLDKMNYVICMIRMNRDTIYLDASRPLLGFGKLPLNCYNGHARVVSKDNSGSIFFDADNIKEQKTTLVNIIYTENGEMAGNYQCIPGFFESYKIREEVIKKGTAIFFDDIKKDFSTGIQISKTGIDSLNDLEFPVKIHYHFEAADSKQDIIYFNPTIGNAYKENPFKSEERKYPVEMSYPIDEVYVLNMQIPSGYFVDELPKSVKVTFNENDGFFQYLIQKDERYVQLRSHIKLNRAYFFSDDYKSLRDFFAYVLKKQNEQIVFKKKK